MRGSCQQLLFRFASVVFCLFLSACGGGGGGGGGNDNNGGATSDTTRPFVVGVQAISPDGTYRMGDQISLSVNFSEPVYVTGVPRLLMQNSIAAQATYVSGNGTNSLRFVLTVLPGDSSADLEYYTSTQLILSTATIRDQAGNDTSTQLPQVGTTGSLSVNSDIVVDGVRPFPLDVYAQSPSGIYFTGEKITITIVFSEPVIVTGTPQLRLETGAVDAVAPYVRGSSTNTLVFEYSVENSHTVDHLTYLANDALMVTGADIQDMAGNSVQQYMHTIGSDRFIQLLPSTWASIFDKSFIQVNPASGPVDTAYGRYGRAALEVGQYIDLTSHTFGITRQGSNVLTCGLGTKAGSSKEITCARFTGTGTPDTTYGNNGLLTLPEPSLKATKLALQADGKLLIAGNNTGYVPSTSDSLCRYLPDATLDTSFGSTATPGCLAGFRYISALSILGDGKIIIVSVDPSNQFYSIHRYNSDGTNLISYVPVTPGGIAIQSVDVQSDGKIVVVGFTGATYTMDAVIARFMQDGQIDTTFGTNGVTSLNLGLDDEYADVRVLPDGGIVAVGKSNSKFLITKFTSQGTFDPSFDADGTISVTAWGTSSKAERVLTEVDGSFFVAGQSYTSTNSFYVVMKYLP